MEQLVIGLVGEKLSGKETFISLWKEIDPRASIHHERFSDILNETLRAWDIETTRQNLQLLPQSMRVYGEDALTRAVRVRICNHTEQLIFLDGVRWLPDESLVRSFPKNLLVYITAPLEVRHERLKHRKEKAGENYMSWKEFIQTENAPSELKISTIGARADFKIVNDKTTEEYRQKVLEIYNFIHTKEV